MRTQRTIRLRPGRGPRRPLGPREAFTLIEMLVVIAIIVLAAGAALPSIVTIFARGAETQTYNVLSAQLTAARALAIRQAKYTAVHVQPAHWADANAPYLAEMKDAFFSAVMIYDSDEQAFRLAQGFTPRRLPGTSALGQVDDEFVIFGSGAAVYDRTRFQSATDIEDFTTLSIVFSPRGSVVRNAGGRDVIFYDEDPVFFNDPNEVPLPETKLWDVGRANEDENGTSAVVIFDYAKFKAAAVDGRRDFLKDNGRLVPVNIHTGQLFE